MAKKAKFPSELRFDLVSKDWVLIATGRAKKPNLFKKEKTGQGKKEELSEKNCPFCIMNSQEKPTLILNKGKKVSSSVIPENWTTIVIPNKFPAVIPDPKLDERQEGPFFKKMNAVGFHEVVVTRDHQKSLGLLKTEEVREVFDAYQQRYSELMKKSFVNYVSIFHNHGKEAGASVFHPHSQIITTPLIDVDLNKALANSGDYFKKTGECIYCQMNEWERKAGKRLVFENEGFLAICPFASKAAFEIIISPKKHLSCFENITEKEKSQLAEAFKVSLNKLYKGLGNPAYNFYLHTAPCDDGKYPHYHWHWTILPKTAAWAGFEIGTRIEISTITPEKAAEYLREQ